MPRPSLPLILAVLPTALWAHETSPTGVGFSHNTPTCRASGYQNDSDELPGSVLITRKADPNQPITGKLRLSYFGNDSALEQLSDESVWR